MWNTFQWAVALLLLTTACGGKQTPRETKPGVVSVMSFNVGNGDDSDANYWLRLSHQAYEDHVAQVIQDHAPDVVVLQEVLPRHTCEGFTESDPARTCYDIANREDPVRRLLGPDYSIVCDARKNVECIGVRTEYGTIVGLESGGYRVDGAETPELPLPPCFWAGGECVDDTTCDAESTVSAVTVEHASGHQFRVVHVHPHAPNFPDAWGAPCRVGQLEQAFTELVDPSLPNLVLGDYNVDAYNPLYAGEDADWWEAEIVGNGWTVHDATAPDGTPYHTTALPMTIDHVVSDGGTGFCTTHGGNGIEPEPGTARLDDGFDWSQVPGGVDYAGRIDHRGITCELTLLGR